MRLAMPGSVHVITLKGRRHIWCEWPEISPLQKRRVWHRDGGDYERHLVKYGQGFCAHLVLAIEATPTDLSVAWEKRAGRR